MKLAETPDLDSYTPYDERTSRERSQDLGPLPSTKSLIKDIDSFLNRPSPDIDIDNGFLVDNPRMYEIDITAMDVNSPVNFFKELRLHEQELLSLPNGIHKPTDQISIYKDASFNIRFDFLIDGSETSDNEYSITLKRVPNADGTKSTFEVAINEISQNINGPSHNIKCNLIYFNEDGPTRIFGDISSDARYLIRRANIIPARAMSRIIEAIKLMSHSVD